MHKVADGHYFISRGVKFGPGDEITEKAFSSNEMFLKKVEAGHIIASGGEDSAAKTEPADKAKSEELKAAKKKKKAASEAVKDAEKVLAAEKENLAKADDLQKESIAQGVRELEAALAESKVALEGADAELAALEGAA
jgi:hypothetical protein